MDEMVLGEADIAFGERDPRKRGRVLLVALLSLLFIAGAGLAAWQLTRPQGDTGSYLIPQGDMTDEEAQEMLDSQAELSRITVSLRPSQELVDGRLHVNFVVVPGNNNFSERLEIEQDGEIVYKSGIVEPEHVIEWGDAPRAREGAATATVYAVDAQGLDFGNPVSVEVEIVEG